MRPAIEAGGKRRSERIRRKMNDQEGELVVATPVEMNMMLTRKPDAVLAEASERASVLMQVYEKKKKKLIINDEPYLEIEDWETVGRFYDCIVSVVPDSTKEVAIGDAIGWEAGAEVVHIYTGRRISYADSMCLNDEPKWSTRPKYEYVYVCKDGTRSVEDPGNDKITWIPNPKKPGKKMPKRERKFMGDEPVPRFQLRSMAQTRACSKALSLAFRWVVVLAGFKATPAEEMDGIGERETKKAEPEPGDMQPESQPDPSPGDDEKPNDIGKLIMACREVEDKLGYTLAEKDEHRAAKLRDKKGKPTLLFDQATFDSVAGYLGALQAAEKTGELPL